MSLLLALIFVAFFGGALVTIARFNAYQARENEARVTGNEVIEIAKAARLYVRDLMITNAALRTAAATPTVIPLTTLKTNGYLSNNFGRQSGGYDLTALGQRIHVVMTNWPIGGDVNDPATVPTAFVLLRHINGLDRSTPQLMMIAMEVAREKNSSIIAPRFNGATNMSDDCVDTTTSPQPTGPSASQWDTGCLSDGDFDTLAAAIPPDMANPITGIEPGGLMVPAWKVIQPDLRIVMRFPQPENPGFATMLTDLQMGTPVDDCTNPLTQVQITTTNAAGATTTAPSGLCDVTSDTSGAGGINRRYNISQISNMSLQRLIAEPQTTDNPGTMAAETASIGGINDDSFRVTGNIALGNDLRIYDQRAMPTTGTIPTARLSMPNGQMAIERNAYLYSNDLANGGRATIGTITGARSLIAGTLNTPQFRSDSNSLAGYGNDAPAINVTSTTDITGDMRVTGGAGAAELITETLNANARGDIAGTTTINEASVGADMVATDMAGRVQVSGTLNANNGPMLVQGTNPIVNGGVSYAAIIGSLDTGGNIQVNNNMTFSDATNTQITAGASRGYASSVTPTNAISTARCLADNVVANGCPNRQYTPPKVTP